jgi:hypothetical protein
MTRPLRNQGRRPGTSLAALAVVGLLLTAACGTTVSLQQAAQDAVGPAGGLSLPGAGSTSSGTASTGDAGVVAGSAGSGNSATGGGAAGTGLPSSGAAHPGNGSGTAANGATPGTAHRLVPANGAPGVTNTTVKIGYEYIESAEFGSAAGGLGLKGTAVGNTREEAQAVLDYINSHGGVAGGRKLVGVPFKQDPTADAATHDQAACAYYTEDNHAFAAMAIDDGMVACLHDHHTVSLSSVVTKHLVTTYPHDMFAPGLYEAGEASAKLAQLLHDHGYFDPGTKLGVIYDPDHKDAFAQDFVPTLHRYGIQVTASAEIDESSSSVAADVQGAQLQFAAKGVNHVVILNAGLLALVFMQQAESQRYHPRYGLWSGNQESLLQSQAFARDQLPRSIGMGWSPANDVDQNHQQPNAAGRQCDAIMKARGLVAVSSLDHALQLAYCATFFFAAEALDAAGSLDPLGFQAGVESLRHPTLSAALGYAESYGINKHWGTGAVRMTAYLPSCSCFVYRSGMIPVS